MPRDGYRNLTISDESYEKLEAIAEEMDKSMKAIVEERIDDMYDLFNLDAKTAGDDDE